MSQLQSQQQHMMPLPTYQLDSDALDRIFAGLKAHTQAKRNKAAKELKHNLISVTRDFTSTEQISRYNNDINKRMYDLIKSNNGDERIGGLTALNALLELNENEEYIMQTNITSSLEENTNKYKMSRYGTYLRHVLPSNDVDAMRFAAQILGKLAMPGGTLTAEFVEFEIKRSLEWLLNDKQELRKHAAVLIIASLALNAPTLVYLYVDVVLENIWITLKDPNQNVREDTALALRNCLTIIFSRDPKLKKEWFFRLYNEASQAFKNGNLNKTTDEIHGSLLCFKELLSKKTSLLNEKLDEMFEILMKLKEHKSVIVRKEISLIIPRLAKANNTKFIDRFLHRVLLFYLSQLKLNKDRSFIFTSIGLISLEVGGHITTYLDGIMSNIREALMSKNLKVKKEVEPLCFDCLSQLAIAIGASLTKYLHSHHVLKLVLKSSINDHLITLLKIFIENLPSLEPIINEKLINTVSLCLSGYAFQPSGSPNLKRTMNHVLAHNYRLSMISKDPTLSTLANSDSGDSYEDADVVVILQAFKILNNFDFKNYSLIDFIKYCIMSYIDHDSSDIRLQTSLTLCNITSKDPICFQVSENSLNTVNEVLDKLLTVAITDIVPEIRLEVLRSLSEDFDPQLSQADNVKLLFTALNDEEFEIRKVTMVIIGRLSSMNPAYIVPSLKKTLIQLLTDLEYGGHNARKKEESAILLSLMISNTKEITRPYVKPILDVLIPKLEDSSSAPVASSAITAIGELSVVGGEDLKPFIKQLMPLLLDTFQDQSSNLKRDSALKLLGQLTSSSGYVIQPLLDYPEILGILVNILKSESSSTIRRETVKLLGVLGALDPYRHREVERGKDSNTAKIAEQNAPPIDVALLMQGMSPSNEEYYPTVVFHTLLKMLKDPSLGAHHSAIIQAIMYIFQTLGLRCVSFLNQIIPGMISVMHTCPANMIEFYFQQLAVLVGTVKQHIRPFLNDLFKVIKDFFHLSDVQGTIIGLIESISRALGAEFKLYIAEVLTLLIDILDNDRKAERTDSLRVLKSLVVFGNSIELYVHLIIPQIVKLFEFAPHNLRKAAIETVGKISRNVSLNEMASRIIHPIVRILQGNQNDDLKRVSMNTLCLLLLQMGNDFSVFIPVINKVLIQKRMLSTVYDQLVTKLLNGEPLPQNLFISKDTDTSPMEINEIEPSAKKLPVNQQLLKNAWDATQKRTKEDWQEWIRRFSVELLKETPSHALRLCAALSGVYYPLAKDLFNASFASVWNELYSQNQESLIQSFCIALSSPNNTPEIHQTLLNLAEFMEHDDKPLPIRISTLGQYAQRCHAYAKALHYKELEFMQEPSTPTIEPLISINNQLQQEDAAIGILKHAQQHHDLQLKETWFEKLGRWEDALSAYNQREKSEPNSMEITMGKMRCLHALGEWEQLSELAQDKWMNSSSEVKRTIAPLAAASSWGLKQWDRMDKYIGVMKLDSPDRSFFNAVLCLHRHNFEEASNHILKARDLLVTEITALVSESYNRAYNVIVRVQMLAELEEIIKYKCYPQGSEKRAMMRKTWNTRLLGCQKNVDIWQRMLKVRALVVNPKQDMEMWIKFANLCRKSGRLGLAEKSLSALLDEGGPDNPGPSKLSPQVVYAQLKYMWATGQQHEALTHLVDFTSKLSGDLGLNENEAIAQPLPTDVPGAPKHVEEYTKLLARCYLKQGEWKISLINNWRKDEAEGILGSFLLATHFDRKWYKAWHNWALANFEVISLHSSEISSNLEGNKLDDDMNAINGEKGVSIEPGLIQHYVVPAIKGFFHSISLSEANSLQDTLRLLTLWFKFGGIPETALAILDGFSMVKIDTWLEVVPQLISRIHQPNPVVSRSLLGLLTDLGKAHPQALVYPLFVAIKSDSVSRQRAALTIIDKMRIHNADLVDQAELVSNELIRAAVLWHELWYEGLEDASRLYFGEHNTEKMFAVLEPLHGMLEKGPETLREVSFQNAFGRELNDAHEWVLNYRRTKDVANLNQAWDIYYNVFRRISRQLPQLQTLDLQYISPKLLAAKDLELAVPGTYQAGKPVVRIISFDPTFSVISSKQRPRKLNIKGSDGVFYQYALKGHEDIRQDSLVMQLFGLVNTLLVNDGECFKRHLDIQQFPAIPLSPKTGLLGWVPNSDTFHVLIREYRESRKIILNIEHRIMLQMAPDYENLTLLQKVEVFTYALDNTRGQDLYKVLWLKSRSSEAWLDRRTTYTRSLAVMSMVGYILGLGDRHPSNLMMDRITGKVVHIDFGDCFEAAILREKYPEKVPFRLTRMLSYAMEVSGIEGSYRITCEHVMRVLRDNKESLMAILEAFAYDPLINWGFDFPINQVAGATGYQFHSVNPAELLRTGQIDAQEAAKMELQYKAEVRNARASLVLKRINDKLTGNDFKRCRELDVPHQVEKLIQQATSVENLCQHYIGWCSFW